MQQLEAFGRWVQGLEALPYVVVAGVAGVVAVALGIGAWQKLRAYRIVTDTRAGRIRSARQGYVALEGRLQPIDPDHPVIAPFSGKPCVWYRAWMEEGRGIGRARRWQQTFSETDPRPCLLDDATGTCAVMVAAADWRLGTVTERWHPDSWSGTERPRPLRHVETGWMRHDVRFCEQRLEPGPGYAIGRLTTTDGTAADDRAAELVEILSGWRTDYMAAVAGRPDRDRPNPRTAAPVRPGTQPDAVARWLRRRGLGGERVHVLGSSAGGGRPLIVGRGEAARVAGRLRWAGIACALGLAVAAAAFALIVLGRHGAVS